LKNDLAKLRSDASLQQSIQDVDKIIEQLERTREQIMESKKPGMPPWIQLPPPFTIRHHRC
jgi:tetrahydromethanopterin S-methyltransferase subunit B